VPGFFATDPSNIHHHLTAPNKSKRLIFNPSASDNFTIRFTLEAARAGFLYGTFCPRSFADTAKTAVFR
jgi:hypothetical protein